MSAPPAELDVLVVGSGVAGLTVALEAMSRGARVGLMTKDDLGTSTSEWAQGGIAAVLDDASDSVESHIEDTLRAGAGLCDESAVRVLVSEAARSVETLVDTGARFDRDHSGQFERAREGGHRVARVVHAGGAATGAEVVRALRTAARTARLDAFEHALVAELFVEDGRAVGVVALMPDGDRVAVRAPVTVLATGGAGQCFAVTTNPAGATADGIACALRAGVAVADLEFVQFHPTALVVPGSPRPLLTEALRGEGALLIDANGERFVDELQPRDVVSRAIAERLSVLGGDHVFLDARPIAGFAEHFPTIAAVLKVVGLDPAHDLLPVAPAAHYLSGGILTDLNGATSMPGLYALGEVACTGVHGANRLASNSLLEGLVFAARCAEVLANGSPPAANGALAGLFDGPGALGIETLELAEIPLGDTDEGAQATRTRLQVAMTRDAGVERSPSGLDRVAAVLATIGHGADPRPGSRAELELANLALFGRALVVAALARHESRGSHTRVDYPNSDERYRLRYSPRLLRD